ncbi:polysaccharide pyruvyl transferase family protein [Actinoplanes sp. NPDC051343]|uniref:polysaccharide pyruvyl transferase family protein n=1 Tax=Actinoplanes sp. NPDC051343 TaxID=3363906 RepID=UPI00378EBD65
MKVVVINAYVRENAGDAALLSVCLRHVREAFPDADVSIAGMEAPERHADFDGCRNIGSVLRYVADGTASRPTRILRRIAVGLAASIYATAPAAVGTLAKRFLPAEAQREIQALSEADLVVSMGGGYLNARPGLDGYQNVFFILLPALIAQKHKVPVVFAPQSYGPFPAAVQRRFVARTLRRAALVLSREDVSVDILTACGLPADRVIRAVDSGFAFDPATSLDWRERLGIDRTTRLVGMTARQWLPPQEQERYERALAAIIDYLHARQMQVVLIPQVTTDYLGDDDRIVSRRIHARCTNKPLLVDEVVDYRDLKRLYGECDFLLGTRFHSVIFALTSRVPCIAIEYEHKTRGIMRDLGLEDWVLPMEDVTYERLRALIERLDEHRDRYLDQLHSVLPAYVGRAESFPELLRVLYRSDVSATVSDGDRAVLSA